MRAKHFSPSGEQKSPFGREILNQRIDAECHVHLLFGNVFAFEFVEHRLGYAADVFSAEYEVDGGNTDALEQYVEFCGRQLFADAEAQRIDSFVEDVERFGIGFGGVIDLHRLMDTPAIVRARTPNIRELACLRAQETEPFEVLGAVVGPHVEALARAPYELALVIRALQIGRNHLFPLLGRNRGKFGEQLFTIGVCHNYFRD